MKKSFVLFLFLVFNLNVFAQKATRVDKVENYGRESWGLQFGITENFSIESFRGATFSYINRYEPDKAITIGVSIDSDFDNSTQRYSSNNPALVTGFRGDIEKQYY